MTAADISSVLQRAETELWEDVTEQVKTIQSIPLKIDFTGKTEGRRGGHASIGY